MNILYDISALGTGHFLNRARTGIFRVVECGAYGLADAQGCSVTFCASQCNFTRCQEYLDAHPVLAEIKFSLPDDMLTKLYNFVEPFKANISHSTFSFMKTKVLRELYNLGKKYTYPLSGEDLVNTDIYHSPFHQIPLQVSREKRITKFQTLHDLIPLLYPQFFSNFEYEMTKKILAGIGPETFVISVSESTKQDLCNHLHGIDPGRIFVIPLAAGEDFYQCTDAEIIAAIKKKYHIPRDWRYLLGVSTLEPRKNIDHTIRCFVRLIREQKIDDLCLVLTGAKGWDYDRIFGEIANSVDVQDKIILTGYVPDEDLSPLYSGSLSFVYPSLYEGFGLPPLEAMQCGTPVITSNTSSLPEVVGDAGIMVAPTDSDALCQAMLDLYRSDALRRDLAQKSLLRAKQFSWQKTTRETINAYKKALNG
jgi:glycosyltransferase involved in cell wall biosynthesis